jgi:hypothetical protein
VFVSVGSTRTPQQSAFRDAVFDELRRNGLDPHTPDQTDHSSDAPLKSVYKELQRSSGSLILAFSRIQIIEGYEMAADGESSVRPFNDRAIATPWNHVEAALAWTMSHPMLVLREDSIVPSGLLERALGDFWDDLEVAVTDQPLPPKVRDVIRSWADKVHAREAERLAEEASRSAGRREISGSVASHMPIGELLRTLTVAQATTAAGGFIGLLFVVFQIGFRL